MAWRARTLLARGCLHTGPPTIHANARRRLSLAAAAAHVIGSALARTGVGLFAPTGEEARAWARPEVLLLSTSWRGDRRLCCFRWIGQCLCWLDILIGLFVSAKTPRRRSASVPQNGRDQEAQSQRKARERQ